MKVLTKKPLQIYLRPDQMSALRSLADRKKASLAELVRQGVDRILTEVSVDGEDPLEKIVGMFDSGIGDLAEKHDEYLAKMIAEENQPWPEKSS